MKDLKIVDSVLAGNRLSYEDALYLLKEGRWTVIAEAAHAYRNQIHDPNVVSYTAFRVVNYTNVCDVDCSFCSFKDEVESKRAYTLSLEQIAEKAEHAQKVGADQIFLQGGVNDDIPLEYYTEVLELLAGPRFDMHVRGFSPIEIKRMAENFKMPIKELLQILKDAGLKSVPGAGAEILTENMRQQLSPKKLSAQDWCDVMGDCHEMGLPGSTNIVFGSTETQEDIIQHLEFMRNQQDKTGGFTTFVPWTFQPQTKKFVVKHVTVPEYIKVLGISRLFFDNIRNVEVSILVLGKEVGELGLFAGANDVNSIVIEENVLRSSGLQTLRAMEKFIVQAGFTPKRRDLNFNFEPYENLEPLYQA